MKLLRPQALAVVLLLVIGAHPLLHSWHGPADGTETLRTAARDLACPCVRAAIVTPAAPEIRRADQVVDQKTAMAVCTQSHLEVERLPSRAPPTV